jgi:tRNA threonylcarbamoyladenosine biosynthesis protein TsaB
LRVLGLDTSTSRASVGLFDGAVVAEQCEPAKGSHAVSLLPLIDAVLAAAGSSTADLDGIAISSGPGSFSGLRIGMSVAKGLAYAMRVPLLAVSTLEALARSVADHEDPICALLDARKHELYTACFDAPRRGWRRLTPDILVTPEALLRLLPPRCVMIGDALDTYGEFLRRALGARVTLLPFEHYSPRGAVVAQMGWEGLQRGETADLPELEPFYIRPSDAERKSA